MRIGVHIVLFVGLTAAVLGLRVVLERTLLRGHRPAAASGQDEDSERTPRRAA